MSTGALLTAEALTVGYLSGKGITKPVAGPLALALRAGELVCLLGPNGAGKSTLLRTLANLQPALAGEIQLTGTALAQLDAVAFACRLSIVLTERVEAGNLTVRELVALGRYPHTGWLGHLTTHDQAQIEAALVATDTTGFARRPFQQLSDGERQRVMLARALAQDTPVILLDEPTAHLDLPNRVRLMRLLHHLARHTGKAILLSTHELDLALQAADRIWLLSADGRLQTGVPEDLVLSGTFAAAFAQDGLAFDQSTGAFVLHEARGQPLRLIGEGPWAFWTRRALQREGFVVTDNPAADQVEIKGPAPHQHWVSCLAGVSRVHPTVADLLQALRAAFFVP